MECMEVLRVDKFLSTITIVVRSAIKRGNICSPSLSDKIILRHIEVIRLGLINYMETP